MTGKLNHPLTSPVSAKDNWNLGGGGSSERDVVGLKSQGILDLRPTKTPMGDETAFSSRLLRLFEAGSTDLAKKEKQNERVSR